LIVWGFILGASLPIELRAALAFELGAVLAIGPEVALSAELGVATRTAGRIEGTAILTLLDAACPVIVQAAIGVSPVPIVSENDGGNPAGRWAVTWAPAMGVRHSIDDGRAVAHWIVAVAVGIIIGPAAVIIIAVAIGVIAPSWISRGDENRGG